MTTNIPTIRVGMVGLGMIFEETYLPVFAQHQSKPLLGLDHSLFRIELSGVASRTGSRLARYRNRFDHPESIVSFAGVDATQKLLQHSINAVCIATPDDRHFEVAQAAIKAGKHVLIEKPSVLFLDQLDELLLLADRHQVFVKVVYHKLADPDHKKLRTLYQDGILQHVNNGYCSLLEPKSISASQFSEWIHGRNPGTYVAVHYLKLIDFTFGPSWKLTRISATGQRGIVGSAMGPTWDSVQLQVIYTHPDQREAAFDIHTSWVTPDNFPGYVDQEVQFRFDNGIWNAHQRKRGVELTVEGRSPGEFKYTPNYHYNGSFLEPWNERAQRGYGLEVIERFFQEVAYVEHANGPDQREERLAEIRALGYNDLSQDRNCVAIVQSLEAILAKQASGSPAATVEVNREGIGLVLRERDGRSEILYAKPV